MSSFLFRVSFSLCGCPIYKLNQLINIVVCSMVECFCPQKESGLRGLSDP